MNALHRSENCIDASKYSVKEVFHNRNTLSYVLVVYGSMTKGPWYFEKLECFSCEWNNKSWQKFPYKTKICRQRRWKVRKMMRHVVTNVISWNFFLKPVRTPKTNFDAIFSRWRREWRSFEVVLSFILRATKYNAPKFQNSSTFYTKTSYLCI